MERLALNEGCKRLSMIDARSFDVSKEIDFLSSVVKDYDYNNINSIYDLAADEYDYLIHFFHKYCNKLYENSCLFKIDPNSTKSFFNPSSGVITYSKSSSNIHRTIAFYHAFTVFHENHHAVQNKMYGTMPSDVLNIDPLAIVMLKENILASYSDLYERNNGLNHHNFVMENDANLMANEFLKSFVEKYFPNRMEECLYLCRLRMRNEHTNYREILLDPNEVSSYMFIDADQDVLPVFYEASKVLRENASEELIAKYPLLGLVCKRDGQMKDYDEITSDMNKALSFVQDESLVYKTDAFSGDGYEYRASRTAKQHIEYIYKVIINSDPLLYMEKCISENDFSSVVSLLLQCPKLFELCSVEVGVLLGKYVNFENYNDMVSSFSEEKFASILEMLRKKYKKVVGRTVGDLIGYSISLYESSSSLSVKSKEALDSDEEFVSSCVRKMIAEDALDKTIGEEYLNVIHEIYDDYRNESSLAYVSYQNSSSSNNIDEDALENAIASRMYDVYHSDV